MQPNKSLILKAMADAHKSTNKSSKRHHEEVEETESHPKKKKTELFTRSYLEKEAQSFRSGDHFDDSNVRKIAITVPNATRTEHLKKMSKQMEYESSNYSRSRQSKRKAPSLTSESDQNVEILEMEEFVEDEGIEEDETAVIAPSRSMPMQADDDQTRFIVTLGPDTKKYLEKDLRHDLRSRLGAPPMRPSSMVEEEEYIEEVEEWEEDDEEMSTVDDPLQTAAPGAVMEVKPKAKSTATVLPQPASAGKLNERCRFWPSCVQGESCLYVHPKVLCQKYPACKFGDKCLYIHPTCKFDANCTKTNCPFMHTTPKPHGMPVKSAMATVPPKMLSTPVALRPKCKFFPKCNNLSCPFYHPTPCRYGISCANKSTCRYSHPDLPSFAKLKWSAPKANETKWTAPKPGDAERSAPSLSEAKPIEKITEAATLDIPKEETPKAANESVA